MTACAAFLEAEYGWSVPRIFPVADVLTGISAALDVFAPTGSPVVVPTPAYPPLFEVVELTGREVVATPLTGEPGSETLDLDAIDAACTAGARTVLLNNPHNPTGRVFTAGKLGALAGLVNRHGARVVSDEVHAPLVYRGFRHVPYATLPDTTAHTVTVISASKAFNLAGLKCAQVALTNTSTRNRHLLVELLAAEVPAIACCAPEASFLSWLDCSKVGVRDPARFFLDRARVAVSDGPPFGPRCEQHVRLNFATSLLCWSRSSSRWAPRPGDARGRGRVARVGSPWRRRSLRPRQTLRRP